MLSLHIVSFTIIASNSFGHKEGGTGLQLADINEHREFILEKLKTDFGIGQEEASNKYLPYLLKNGYTNNLKFSTVKNDALQKADFPSLLAQKIEEHSLQNSPSLLLQARLEAFNIVGSLRDNSKEPLQSLPVLSTKRPSITATPPLQLPSAPVTPAMPTSSPVPKPVPEAPVDQKYDFVCAETKIPGQCSVQCSSRCAFYFHQHTSSHSYGSTFKAYCEQLFKPCLLPNCFG
jgi:hypothetical protein